jgi:outer membrane protein OmpA-like peptidoglycan-associated protein
MTTTRWLIIVTWVAYVAVLMWWYGGTYAQQCCNPATESAAIVPPAPDETSTTNPYPLAFREELPIPFTGPGGDSLVAAIKAAGGPNQALEIEGFYYESEEAPDDYQTMGFARADFVRKRFFGELGSERIRTRSRRLDGSPPGDQRYFEGLAFTWEDLEPQAEETIEELDDRILIRFPYGSTQRDYDAAVDEYLDDLAERVRGTGESISLTGHTDNVGSAAFNRQLGMDRANAIRTILLSKGVPADQMKVSSRGLSDPIDTNDTETGRHNNRRVEVRLLADENTSTTQ